MPMVRLSPDEVVGANKIGFRIKHASVYGAHTKEEFLAKLEKYFELDVSRLQKLGESLRGLKGGQC